MRDKQVRHFLRAAGQRLDAANILLTNSMNVDAMYLAGYSVECSLKALILANTPEADREVTIAEAFRGTKAHDYEFLKGLLAAQGVRVPPRVVEDLRLVTSWTTAFRYESGIRPSEQAASFCRAARRIYTWVKGRT